MPHQSLLTHVLETLEHAGVRYMLTGSTASSIQGEPSAASGNNVDFWLLTDEPFDHSRFARRQQVPLFGMEVWVSSPEDTILAKLRWSRISGGSDRQERDALAVYELQFARLDHGYLDEWADRLEVTTLLEALREASEPLD